MRNRQIVMSMVMLVIFLNVVGCVPQDEYNKLQEDMTTLQNQYNTLQSEYDKLKGDYADLKTTHDTLIKDHDQTKADLEAAERKADGLKNDVTNEKKHSNELQKRMDKINVLVKVLQNLLAPSFNRNITESQAVKMLLELSQSVKAVGDPVLEKKFDDLLNSGGSRSKTDEFLKYLLESLSKLTE